MKDRLGARGPRRGPTTGEARSSLSWGLRSSVKYPSVTLWRLVSAADVACSADVDSLEYFGQNPSGCEVVGCPRRRPRALDKDARFLQSVHASVVDACEERRSTLPSRAIRRSDMSNVAQERTGLWFYPAPKCEAFSESVEPGEVGKGGWIFGRFGVLTNRVRSSRLLYVATVDAFGIRADCRFAGPGFQAVGHERPDPWFAQPQSRALSKGVKSGRMCPKGEIVVRSSRARDPPFLLCFRDHLPRLFPSAAWRCVGSAQLQ